MGYALLVWVLPFFVIKDWVLLDFTLVFDTWDLLTLKVWDSFGLEEEGLEWEEDLTKLMCDGDEQDIPFLYSISCVSPWIFWESRRLSKVSFPFLNFKMELFNSKTSLENFWFLSFTFLS